MASINGAGTASIRVTCGAALLGAKASLEGSSVVSVSAKDVRLLPLNDASPLRTGVASFSVTGTLTPYAIGQLSGTTEDKSGLTADAVAQAVWSALAQEFDVAGTMGQKVNAAGTAGDPWTGEIFNGMTAQEAMQVLLSVLVGKAEGGGTGTITFRDVEDSRDVVRMTVDANGNRTAVEIS